MSFVGFGSKFRLLWFGLRRRFGERHTGDINVHNLQMKSRKEKQTLQKVVSVKYNKTQITSQKSLTRSVGESSEVIFCTEKQIQIKIKIKQKQDRHTMVADLFLNLSSQ